MPVGTDTMKERLSRANEITITVTGRKSGRPISNTVWFALEGDQLYLLPVYGSDTQWYKNVLKNPSLRVEAGGVKTELKVAPLTDSKQVSSVVDQFRKKYGPGDVKKYYSKFDAGVVAHLR